MKSALQLIILILFGAVCSASGGDSKSGASTIARVQSTAVFTPNNIEADLQNNGLLFSNFNNQTIYGAIYGSTDNGATWTELDAGLSRRSIVSLVTLSGSGSTNLFAGTDSGVYRSTDDGLSWSAANTGLTALRVQCLGVIGSNLFASVNFSAAVPSGVFRSSDAGQAWARADSGLDNRQVMCFASSDTILYAGRANGGVWRTTNLGKSWTSLGSGYDTAATVNPLVASGSWLFSGINGLMYRSTDKGATWSHTNTGLGGYLVEGFAVNGTSVYVGTINDGAFVSQDAGASWSPLNNGLPMNIFNLLAFGTKLYAGTYGNIFASTNNGLSWQVTTENLPDTYYTTAMCGSDNKLFFAGTPLGTVAGLHWPAGTRKTPVYAAGLWIIGRSSLDHKLHSASSQYHSEYQPGPLKGTYNGDTTTIPSIIGDPQDPKWDIMMLSRSTPPSDPVYQRWASGAVPGAPMTVGGTPQVIGDAAAYWVTNDLNLAGHTATSTTSPMGLEVQNYFFGSTESPALNNTIFMGFHIINKSTITYDSTFIGLFSDSDIGDPTDDCTGCDTARSLGYTYNGGAVDAIYESASPAVGYDFIEGPKVPSTPSDSALYNGHWIKGYKNLPMTAFSKFINSSDVYSDPWLGTQSYIQQAYNLLMGYVSISGQPFLTPGGVPSKFVDSGDPVTGTGWLSSFERPPSDVRELLSSGPLTLQPGDTQEVFIALTIGGGTDRLNSITVLRQYDDTVQRVIDNNFPGLTGVREYGKAGVPGQFSVSQNFPNPFNPTTTIQYQLPEAGRVVVTIYNLLGQKVRTLLNGVQTAGSHSLVWNTKSDGGVPLASGVYFYRVEVTGNAAASIHNIETRKMILLQ